MILSKRISRILIFLTLSSVSIFLILFFTTTEKTLTTLMQFPPLDFLKIILAWVFLLFMDTLAIKFFTRGTGERIHFFEALKTATIRVLFNLLTPFSFGGQPFMVYSLSKEGIPAGKASSIVITKLITLSTITQLCGISAFIYLGSRVNTPIISMIFIFTAIISFLFIVFVASGLLYPHCVIFLVLKAGKLFHHLNIFKNEHKYRRKVLHEFSLARRSFRNYFRKHLISFILGTMASVFMYLTSVLMLWFILKGFQLEMTFIDGFFLSALLLFLISLIPTPGTAGGGEALFLVVLAPVVPKYLLGIAVVLWRFFYQYLSAILGVLFSAGHFSELMIKTEEAEKYT